MIRKTILLAALASAFPARALDGLSLEIGGGEGTKVARAAAQWNWQNKWLAERPWQLGGYWELSGGAWDNPRRNIVDLGFTPVFRYAPASGAGPYLEGGIGVHYLSGFPARGSTEFSSHLQFGSHVGIGWRFGERARYDLGVRVQHVSNAGIDEPNPGINLLLLRFQHHLD